MTTSTTSAYAKLEQRFHRIMVLGDAGEALQWDYATMMPAGGGPGRAEQLAELSAVRHCLLNDGETGDLLAAAAGDDSLDHWQSPVSTMSVMRCRTF